MTEPGNQLRVANNTSIPVNCKHFLRVGANKDSVFHLLAGAIQEFQPAHGKQKPLRMARMLYHLLCLISPTCTACQLMPIDVNWCQLITVSQ